MTNKIANSSLPVELWYTRCGSATVSALAIKQGWLQAEFAQEGTVLHSLAESNDIDVRNAHFNHQKTGLFREGGNIPPIWAKSAGNDTAVIGITWLDEYQGVLVRADSDIHNLADLKGKKLGVPKHQNALIDFQRGAAHHGYATTLSLAKLSIEDVILVDIEIPSYSLEERRKGPEKPRNITVDALKNGDVDAIFIRYASGYRLSKEQGIRELININHLPNPLDRVNNGTPRPITVDRKFLDKHPDIVARYLAVLLRTAEWASQHPYEVAELLTGESGGGVEDVLNSHGKDVYLSFKPSLSERHIAGLTTQKDFLRDWGYLQSDFKITDWIDERPLAAAQKLFEAQPHFTGVAQDNLSTVPV
jgi:sulfonate transport system substrate-binding protein